MVMKLVLLEFLKFGLKYVYPQRPSGLVRGVVTAHSAASLVNVIQSDEVYVWSYAKGKDRGLSIEPLHNNIPEAALRDKVLHEILALIRCYPYR